MNNLRKQVADSLDPIQARMKPTSHATSPETSALALSVSHAEAMASSLAGSGFITHSDTTFDVPPDALNLYSILQQEVDIGVQAFERESADVAVTFCQSALQKMTVDLQLYDHLVHNLLLSYKLLIKQLLKNQGTSIALEFLRAALRLEIRGKMAEDATFLSKFADALQDLGVVLLHNGLHEASLLCCRKAISVYPSPGAHVNLTNALAATGGRARLSDFTTDIRPEQLGRHIFIACLPKSASTFLKNLLLKLTGYRDRLAVYAAGQN
jgi:hypothetical protein